MGVTISHSIGIQTGRVKSVLDTLQRVAEQIAKEQASKLGISFELRRLSDHTLLIDIGNCETLSFEFSTYEDRQEDRERRGLRWEDPLDHYFGKKVLATADNPHLKNWPDQRLLWSSSFCKTQFAKSIIEHKWVADLIKTVASVADYAHIHDEGDYYHTGKLEDASGAIHENGMLINSITGMLTGKGWEDTQIVNGGETVIKPRKTRKQKEAEQKCAWCGEKMYGLIRVHHHTENEKDVTTGKREDGEKCYCSDDEMSIPHYH